VGASRRLCAIRVDDRDGVGEFGADVGSRRSEGSWCGAKVAEFDGGGEFALLQVDDVYGGAVVAGLADAGMP